MLKVCAARFAKSMRVNVRPLLREINFRLVIITMNYMIKYSKIWVPYNRLKSKVKGLEAENHYLKERLKQYEKKQYPDT